MTFSVNILRLTLSRRPIIAALSRELKPTKWRTANLPVFYGKLENAPLIEQCPINHACEVIQILNLGSHELVVGKIVETHISEEYFTDGHPDAVKMRPFLFASGKYYALGEFLGDAFRTGRTIDQGKPKKVSRNSKNSEKERKRENSFPVERYHLPYVHRYVHIF